MLGLHVLRGEEEEEEEEEGFIVPVWECTLFCCCNLQARRPGIRCQTVVVTQLESQHFQASPENTLFAKIQTRRMKYF